MNDNFWLRYISGNMTMYHLFDCNLNYCRFIAPLAFCFSFIISRMFNSILPFYIISLIYFGFSFICTLHNTDVLTRIGKHVYYDMLKNCGSDLSNLTLRDFDKSYFFKHYLIVPIVLFFAYLFLFAVAFQDINIPIFSFVFAFYIFDWINQAYNHYKYYLKGGFLLEEIF